MGGVFVIASQGQGQNISTAHLKTVQFDFVDIVLTVLTSELSKIDDLQLGEKR